MEYVLYVLLCIVIDSNAQYCHVTQMTVLHFEYTD